MSIQSVSSAARAYFAPVSRPSAPAAAPVPAAMATPVFDQSLPVVSEVWSQLKSFGTEVADLLFWPYRLLTGKIGADAFVRPGMGSMQGDPPSKWGLAYETMNFQSTDGTPLKGWYMPAANPTDKTIILTHGHSGHMSDVLWRWAPWLHKAGYNLMAFDFRNSGGSGGTRTTMGFEERRDLSAALDQVQAKGAKHIAVMGLSMGAATTLSLAPYDTRIEAIVADCSFDTIEHAVASRVKRNTFDLGPFKGLHFPFQDQVTRAVVEASERLSGHTAASPQGSLRSADPLLAMPKLQDRPIFLIHGQDDDETFANNSENLAKANPNAQLWLVPGAKHGESYQKAKTEYQSRVLDFLSKSF